MDAIDVAAAIAPSDGGREMTYLDHDCHGEYDEMTSKPSREFMLQFSDATTAVSYEAYSKQFSTQFSDATIADGLPSEAFSERSQKLTSFLDGLCSDEDEEIEERTSTNSNDLCLDCTPPEDLALTLLTTPNMPSVEFDWGVKKTQLNSKAPLFQPMTCDYVVRAQDLAKTTRVQAQDLTNTTRVQGHEMVKGSVDKLRKLLTLVLNHTKHSLELQHADKIRSVDLFEDLKGFRISIQATGKNTPDGEIKHLIDLAKATLTDSMSTLSGAKHMHILGFRCPTGGFHTTLNGAIATVGVMKDANKACWHLYKKGYCQHGQACKFVHPCPTSDIEIIVEGMQVGKKSRAVVQRFCKDVASLVEAVATDLAECSYTAQVECTESSGGWTIEVTPQDSAATEADFWTLAQGMLSKATNPQICITRFATMPYTCRQSRFTCLVANVNSVSDICFDCYSKGQCKFGDSSRRCRFQHPTCLMPITFSVKECRF
jgi:hypothetical protein